MTQNTQVPLDLVRLFNAVTTTLKQNQQTLNEADEYNHNHGDNMVENFQTITRAVRSRKASTPADQLSYASEVLQQRANSGSAQVYSQGLAQAANRMQGKQAVTMEDAVLLLQSLMGAQPAASVSAQQASGIEDMLGGLLGGQTQQGGKSAGSGDLMGGLLGGLLGGATGGQQSARSSGPAASGIDLNMLLTAGMAFYQARQQGVDPMQAMVQAVLSGSQMQSSAHRSQSGQIVATTILNTIGKMVSGSKRRK